MTADARLAPERVADLTWVQQLADLGFWEWEIPDDTVRWSDPLFELFGVDPGAVDELDLGSFLDVVDPRDRGEVRERIREARETGAYESFEFRVPRPDGAVAWFVSRGEVVLDGDGTPVRMRGTVQEVTERRELERELTERSELFEQAQRIAGLGVVEASPGASEHAWSEGVYRILGLDPGGTEPTLERFLEFVHPDDREEAARRGYAALEHGEEAHLSHRIVRPDGEVRHVEGELRVREDVAGGRRVVATILDTTRRARLERELRAKRVRLEEAQRLADVGHWDWDADSGRITGSQQMYELLGLEDREPLTVEGFLDRVHPGDLEAARAAMDRAVSAGEATAVQYRFERPDGSTRWMESRLVPEVEAGGVVGIRGTVQDVTDRERLEEELRGHKARLEEAQRLARLGSWEWHVPSGELTWSGGLYRLFGLDPDEIGTPTLADFLDVVHPEERERVRGILDEVLETRRHPTFQFRVRQPDGTVRRLESRGEVEVEDGEAVRVRGTALDVTEREQLLEELREAKTQAEAADRAKSLFLANVSHEVRTPLTTILGLADLLLEADPPGGIREDVETIRASGRHLLSILDDVLDLSRIESAQLSLDEAPFDLRRTVEEVLDMLAPQAADRDLDLAYSVGEDVPEAIAGDERRLRQVLANLGSNAVKFTDEGAVTVTLESEPGDPPWLVASVHDTGVGIAAGDREGLFEPFTQVDAGAERSHPGTGLGLAISHRLAELMGGSIDVESTPGEGSTFTFRVPAPPATPAPARSWKQAPEAFQGVRVLAVDDNEVNLGILRRRLEGWGMDVHATASPDEALEIARRERFGLVVTDFAMPGTSGTELARRIAEADPEPPPILLLTSMPGPAAEDAGPEVTTVIDKPVKPRELFDALSTILGGPPAAPEPSGLFDERTADRHPMTILVVEDSDTNRLVQQRVLGRLGYDPDAAANGREAVERFEDGNRYDLVLMDVQMPRMDGLEATRRIRERVPEDEQPRIVALTAHAADADRDRCLEAGMDGYLAKPIEPEELATVLAAGRA